MKNDLYIVSSNCWGAEVYIDFKLEYNTPFVGLFVPPLCFAKLCNNLEDYCSVPLQFVHQSKYRIYDALRKETSYPIALLKDVEIHFLHYKTPDEARTKWERRMRRMHYNPAQIRVMSCDREMDEVGEFVHLWNNIPYSKVFFSSRKDKALSDLVFISQYAKSKEVTDGKKLYEVSKRYFDLNRWLQTGDIKINHLYTTLRLIA